MNVQADLNLCWAYMSKGILSHIVAHMSSLVNHLEYRRLSLSQSPKDSVKYFEISIPQHIRFAELREK